MQNDLHCFVALGFGGLRYHTNSKRNGTDIVREAKNIYYRYPSDWYWLPNSPKQVYETAFAIIRTLPYITSIEDYSWDKRKEFGKTIIASGEMKFIRKKLPLGLYLEVSARNLDLVDGAMLLPVIYFRNVSGFLIETFGEILLRRKWREIDNMISERLMNVRHSKKEIASEKNVPIRWAEEQLSKEQIDELVKAATGEQLSKEQIDELVKATTDEKLERALASLEEAIERTKQVRIERRKQRSRERLRREAALKGKKEQT